MTFIVRNFTTIHNEYITYGAKSERNRKIILLITTKNSKLTTTKHS